MVMRHRRSLRDATFIVGIISVAGMIAFEYDFSSELQDEKKVEFRELLALCGIVVFSIFFFGWRRMAEQDREIERRLAAEQRAHALANTDPLTGLANRRRFEKDLREVIASPPGAEKIHAVILLDLNGFKLVNDVYGHPVGDEVLVEVAHRLAAAVREGDLLARLGGDEFGIIALILLDLRRPTASPSV